jgi:hypothetical protein
MVGLNAITSEAWNTATTTEDKKEKIQALYFFLSFLRTRVKSYERDVGL